MRLADQVLTPPAIEQEAIPQETTAPPSSPDATPTALAASANRPPPDALAIKLRRLAQLHQPIIDQDLSKSGEGLAREAKRRRDAIQSSEAALKDFVRGQIEHHWSIDLSELHNRAISISLRLRISRNGVVSSAAVVAARGLDVGSGYDEAALSARNAALMSSPLSLPPGQYPDVMDVIVDLNTQDALR